MITIQDEETLARLLGTAEIPENLKIEVELRTAMYHRSGESGPLGAVGLIDACRALNYRPKAVEKAKEKIDWRQYPSDGSTLIEAGPYMGEWRPGTFLGFVEGGILAVKLDDDEKFVREVRPDMVRLSSRPRRESSEDEGPDARINLLTDNQGGTAVLTEPKAKQVVSDAPHDAPEFEAPSKNWTSVATGQKVWVDTGEDIEDGIFHEIQSDGMLLITLSGKKTPELFSQDAVNCASA